MIDTILQSLNDKFLSPSFFKFGKCVPFSFIIKRRKGSQSIFPEIISFSSSWVFLELKRVGKNKSVKKFRVWHSNFKQFSTRNDMSTIPAILVFLISWFSGYQFRYRLQILLPILSKFFFLNVILSIQGWRATTRHGFRRKKNTKRLKHSINLFRKNLQIKGVC